MENRYEQKKKEQAGISENLKHAREIADGTETGILSGEKLIQYEQAMKESSKNKL